MSETLPELLQPEYISSIITGIVTASATLLTISKGINQKVNTILEERTHAILEPFKEDIEDISTKVSIIKNQFNSLSYQQAITIYDLYVDSIMIELNEYMTKFQTDPIFKEMLEKPLEIQRGAMTVKIKKIINDSREKLLVFKLTNGRTLKYLVEITNSIGDEKEGITRNLETRLSDVIEALRDNNELKFRTEAQILLNEFFGTARNKFTRELAKLYPNEA